MSDEDLRTLREYFLHYRDMDERRVASGIAFAEQIGQIIGFLDRFGVLLRIASPVMQDDEAAIEAVNLDDPPPDGEGEDMN